MTQRGKVDGGRTEVDGLQDELRLRHPVLMQCCTCDLCGCGPVFEFIFAAAGTAWCAYDMQSHDFINRIACFSKCQCGGKGTKVSVKGLKCASSGRINLSWTKLPTCL